MEDTVSGATNYMCINDKKLYIKVSNSILCLKSWSKAQRVGDKINQDFRPKKGLDGTCSTNQVLLPILFETVYLSSVNEPTETCTRLTKHPDILP